MSNLFMRLRAKGVRGFPPARDLNTEPPPPGLPAEPSAENPPEVVDTQAEFTAWNAAHGDTFSVANAETINSATNIFVYRMKACGAHDALIDYGSGAGGTQASSLQGFKGVMNAGDWSVQFGTVTWEEMYGFSSTSGARISYDLYTFKNIPGVSPTSFGVGFGLTTNYNGIMCEMGAYEPATGYQVNIRASGGFNSGARLGGVLQLFGDANSVGFTYACKLATDNNANAGTYCSDGTVYPATGAVTGLPNSKLVLLAGGVTGNSASVNRVLTWFVGALTPNQLIAVRDAVWEYYENLGIRQEIEVPPVTTASLGPNCFSRTTIDAVLPSDLRIMQFSPPPASNATDYTTYSAFPLTDCFVRATPTLNNSTWTPTRDGRVFQIIWVNSGERDDDGNGNPIGPLRSGRRWQDPNGSVNPITEANPTGKTILRGGVVCAPVYSTKRKARYATLAIAAWHAGYAMRDDLDDPRGWGVLDYVEAGGFPAEAWQDQDYWALHRDEVFVESIDSKWCGRDIIMPGYYRLSDITTFDKGLFFDHEPADFPDGNPWATGTAYAVGMPVTLDYVPYRCLVAHTSGTFATDLAAGKWEEVDSLHVEFIARLGEITNAKGFELSVSPHPLDSTTTNRDGFNPITCPVLMQDPNYTWYAIDARRIDTRGYGVVDSVKKQLGLATGPSVFTAVYNPPSLDTGTSATTTVPAPGLVAGHTVYAPSFSAALRSQNIGATGYVQMSAQCVNNDEIAVTFTNNTGVTQNVSQGTITVLAEGGEPIDPSKVQVNAVIGVGVARMSEAEMTNLHNWCRSVGVGMIYPSPGGSIRGGDITQPHQRLRAILYGLPLSP